MKATLPLEGVKQPVHVLFIVENNPVPGDRRVWPEVLAARELGHHVSVICPKDSNGVPDPTDIPYGVKIYYHPMLLEGRSKLGFILEYVWALLAELLLSIRIYAGNPFQVIHAANPPDHVFLIAALYKVLGVRFIFDHHDLAPETYQAIFGRKGLAYRALLWMERLTFRVADVVISTNASYKQVAIERGGKDLRDVFVVRNAPLPSRIRHMPPNPDFRAGFSHLVGYVGKIGKQDAVDNLIRIVAHVVNELGRSDIRFVVIGSGTHLTDVVRLAKEMGVERYVWFTGYVPEDMLCEILSSVDVCVNPEFRNEFTDKSTMLKIMEYMTFGKPIVQFRTTEGEVTARDAAVYVDNNCIPSFAKALIELLEDQDRRAEMGRLGRTRIEQVISWDEQKAVLGQAYDRVCQTKAWRPSLHS